MQCIALKKNANLCLQYEKNKCISPLQFDTLIHMEVNHFRKMPCSTFKAG